MHTCRSSSPLNKVRVKELVKRLLARFGLYLHKGYPVYFFSNKKIVRRSIYGRETLMPRSHSIPVNLAFFPWYNSNLQRIVSSYQQIRKDAFSILDIGANIGDTLLMLRQVTDHPIHCFEGDPYYFRLLEENTAGIAGSHLHQVLLSDKPATLKVKSNINLGSSTFTSDAEEGEAMEFSTVDNFAAEHFPTDPVGLIKTDTDGYDLKILRGSQQTIEKWKPVLFLEFDRSLFEKNGDDGAEFLDWVKELGYSGLLVYDNYGKLLCVTTLQQKNTLRALLAYIKNQKLTIPFYDLAIFPAADQAVFEALSETETALFEQ
jgi:FkbM family methyltransferase